jgi:GTPase Era involved in 16S rRNA processing
VSLLNQQSAQSEKITNLNYRDLPFVLQSISDLIESIGPDAVPQRNKLTDIRERLTQQKIHLAVLGQFKRGKSSLLNALLGAPVLPTSVIPLTSIPTYIKFGAEPYVRIYFNGDKKEDSFHSPAADELRRFLIKYVSEEANPKNRYDVAGVELIYNAPILRDGVVLIDTPGIGSTHLHNTEATLNFLPQCDAALFLISADPPITETELVFLKEVKKKISRIFFILNKIDYLSPDERQEVMRFISRVLNEKAGITEESELFPVSARNGLEAAVLKNDVLWKQSGINVLEKRLLEFMSHDKLDVLHAALVRKSLDLIADLDIQESLALKALKLPVEEIEKKLALFNQKISEAEQQKLYSNDVLTGEQKRLQELLEEQSAALRKKSQGYLDAIVQEYLRNSTSINETEINEAIAKAIPVFFEHELGEMAEFFDKRVVHILNQHQQRADEIIASVRKQAASIFDLPYREQDKPEGIEFVREPYWVLHSWKSSLSPIPVEWIDRLVPKSVRKRRIKSRLDEQLHDLILHNVENLRWATYQNLDLTFRKFTNKLEEQFLYIIQVIHQTIDTAFEKRKSYADRMEDETGKLEKVLTRISEIKTLLEMMTK